MGPLASIGLASYAYLPVFELLLKRDCLAPQKLLDNHVPTANLARPSAETYYGISRTLLESKDQDCSSFLVAAYQTVLPVDPNSKATPPKASPENFITIGTMLSQPFSRGSVHITSGDTEVTPTVDPRYLSYVMDLEVLARCAQYIEIIAASEPFKSLLGGNGRHAAPDSYLEELDAAKAYVRRTAISMLHPTSTFVMMPREKGGIVNERLRAMGH